MSEVRVNVVSPRSAANVDFGGIDPPAYLGQALAIEQSVADRFSSLDGTVINSADPTNVFTSGNIAGQLLELYNAILAAKNPVGTVVQGVWTAAPAGTVELNGQVVNRVGTHANLYALAVANGMIIDETTWLASNRTLFSLSSSGTTFRVPDYRGVFLRAMNAGRTLSSYQADALQNITGTFGAAHGGTANNSGAFAADSTGVNHVTAGTSGTDPSWSFDASRVARTSTETRPINVALLTCMYY